MKKILFLLCCFPFLLFAQEQKGINFETTKTWSELLAMAKMNNKLVFLDIYTDWCGPCKDMEQRVFPLPKVGELYNRAFINYKLDAEKGEGIAIAKQFKINAYPTYLFLNGDGELVYRLGGSREAEEFMQEGKNALAESLQPDPIAKLESLYPNLKTDKGFMYNYIRRLTKLKAPTGPLLNEYVALLSKAEQTDPKVIKLIVDNGTFLNRKIELGLAMDALRENVGVFENLKQQQLIKGQESIRGIEEAAMENSLMKAIQQKDENGFKKVRLLSPDFVDNKFENKHTLDIDFYYGIKDVEKFKRVTKDFIENYLLKIPADSLAKWDAAVYAEVKAYYIKKNDPKINLEEELFSYGHTQTIQLSNLLYHSSERLLNMASLPGDFKLAKNWIMKAVKIAEQDPKYYENVLLLYRKIYAKALYQSGEQKVAIGQMEKIMANMPANMRQAQKQELVLLFNDMKTAKKIK